VTQMYLTRWTSMPAVSAAVGCSPTALILRPRGVLKSRMYESAMARSMM